MARKERERGEGARGEEIKKKHLEKRRTYAMLRTTATRVAEAEWREQMIISFRVGK